MQGQKDRERDASSNTLTNINPDQQRQMDFFLEWLNQGSPGTLIGQMMESGIDSENHRRAFMELMNQVDAELNARGIGFQRTNPDSGQVGNESLMVQQANVSFAHHPSGIDLNATPEQRREFGGGQTLRTPTRPDGPVAAADQNALPAAGADSSYPILISSGGGNALKADDDAGGQGHGQGGASSSNNRPTSFKRRAPGDAPRQLLLGESSSSVQQEQARESEQEDVVAAPQENAGTVALNNELTGVGMLGVANSSAMNGTQNAAAAGITVLEAGIGGVPTVNHHRPSSVAAANGLGGGSVMNQNQTSNEARNGAASPGLTNNNNQASVRARQTEIFQRNIRARRNPNLRDFTPTAGMLTQSPPSQTDMFYSFDDFVNSLPQPQFPPTPAAQIVQDSEAFQTQQVQGITMPSGSPSSSARTSQLQPRNVMFRAAEFEPGNLSHRAANMNLANGNTNFPGNNAPAAATQDGSNSSSRISAVPIWYPRQAINYSNRMLEVLRRAESRGLHGDYRIREMDDSSRGGNMRPQPRTSRLMPRDETQDGDDPDFTLSGRPLASEVYMLNYL